MSSRPSKNVFASSMDTAVVRQGYDILMTDIGDAYVVEAATDKGKKLLCYGQELEGRDADDLKSRKAVWEKNKKGAQQAQARLQAVLPAQAAGKGLQPPVWEEKARLCYSCGSCNQVCPTCYCFDVQDEVNWDLKTGTRCRAWDGCLLENFATVAGNHNFRKKTGGTFPPPAVPQGQVRAGQDRRPDRLRRLRPLHHGLHGRHRQPGRKSITG